MHLDFVTSLIFFLLECADLEPQNMFSIEATLKEKKRGSKTKKYFKMAV